MIPTSYLFYQEAAREAERERHKGSITDEAFLEERKEPESSMISL